MYMTYVLHAYWWCYILYFTCIVHYGSAANSSTSCILHVMLPRCLCATMLPIVSAVPPWQLSLMGLDSGCLLLIILLCFCVMHTCVMCSKLEWNRQVQSDPQATGIKGSIPAAWSSMVNLTTL